MTEKVEIEFVKWIQDDCPFWYEMNKHYWEEPKSSKKYTLEKLYKYWLDNVKSDRDDTK